MNIFLTCLFKGVYKEYSWLYKEYNKSWSNPKNYSELSPKEIKFIIIQIRRNFIEVYPK